MIREKLKGHAIWFGVIVILIAMPATWGALYYPTRPLGDMWAGAVQYAATAAMALVCMWAVWRTPLFSFRGKHFFKGLFTFGLLGVLGAAGAFFFSADAIDLSPPASAVLACVALNLAIAVGEEVLFRGVVLNAMLRAWAGKRRFVMLSVIASSVLFGLRHLLNLVSKPDAVMLTLAQVVFTFMAGLYLCAVYLRTQNIWVCITIHFLEDIAVSIWEILSSPAAAAASMDAPPAAILGMVALQIPYVVFAVLMLRDKKWTYAGGDSNPPA